MCHGTTTMAGYKVVRRSDPGHGTNVAAVIVTVIVVSTLRCGRKNPGSSLVSRSQTLAIDRAAR